MRFKWNAYWNKLGHQMEHDRFELTHDLSAIVGSQKIVSASIGPNSEACLLLVSPEDEGVVFGREERQRFASFPLSRAKNSYAATFIRFKGTVLQRTQIAEIKQAHPTVQSLPDDEILVVGARCHFRDGNPEKNAAVINRDGKVAREFVLGDGIQDVQTTKDGMIWASYFDEGVFGNFGWDKPMGASGLVCFDSMGRRVWDYAAPAGFDAMADCYAMNVADDCVWACYYTDFPIVRIDAQKTVRGWANTVGGASAMAVSNGRVALWGGYGEKHSRCVVQELGDRELQNPREVSVKLPEGLDLKGIRAIGRGNFLHVWVGPRCYRWEPR